MNTYRISAPPLPELNPWPKALSVEDKGEWVMPPNGGTSHLATRANARDLIRAGWSLTAAPSAAPCPTLTARLENAPVPPVGMEAEPPAIPAPALSQEALAARRAADRAPA